MIATDKIKHLSACAIVAFLASVAIALTGAGWPASSLAGFMAGMAIGIGKEYGDKCASGNHWDWADILADTIGALVGCCAGVPLTLIL